MNCHVRTQCCHVRHKSPLIPNHLTFDLFSSSLLVRWAKQCVCQTGSVMSRRYLLSLFDYHMCATYVSEQDSRWFQELSWAIYLFLSYVVLWQTARVTMEEQSPGRYLARLLKASVIQRCAKPLFCVTNWICSLILSSRRLTHWLKVCHINHVPDCWWCAARCTSFWPTVSRPKWSWR